MGLRNLHLAFAQPKLRGALLRKAALNTCVPAVIMIAASARLGIEGRVTVHALVLANTIVLSIMFLVRLEREATWRDEGYRLGLLQIALMFLVAVAGLACWVLLGH
jgi:hypothetical protein